MMPTSYNFLHDLAVRLFIFYCFFSYLSTQSTSLISNGLSVTLNGVPYYVSPYAAGRVTVNAIALSKSTSVNGIYPITVVQATVSSSELPGLLKNFSSSDDVFQTAFTQGMPKVLPKSPRIPFPPLLKFQLLQLIQLHQ
jgi:hypothetical protein